MKKQMGYGVFVRNAKACENAKHPKCKCVCQGKFHGKSHDEVMGILWTHYLENREPAPQEGDTAAPTP